jgi:hypothetical protein
MVSFAVATATALSCPTCKFAPHAELLPRNALVFTNIASTREWSGNRKCALSSALFRRVEVLLALK